MGLHQGGPSVRRPCGQGHRGCSLSVWAVGLPLEGRTCLAPEAGLGPPAAHLSRTLLSAFRRGTLAGVCPADSSWFSCPPRALGPMSSHAGLPGLGFLFNLKKNRVFRYLNMLCAGHRTRVSQSTKQIHRAPLPLALPASVSMTSNSPMAGGEGIFPASHSGSGGQLGSWLGVKAGGLWFMKEASGWERRSVGSSSSCRISTGGF